MRLLLAALVMLTTTQAAAAIGVTPGRIRHMLRDGMLPGARKHGRDWLIPQADIDAVLDSRK